MPKYLIIGKNGTLGNEFQKLLGKEAISLDRPELDIIDKQAVLNKISELNPEVVINCAAYNAVDKAEEEPEVAFAINGTAVGNLAKATEKIGAIFIHFSTNYVFKGDRPNGYKETDKTNPQSKYGESKLLGEQEAINNCSRSYVIRTAWLYGQQGNSNTSKINYIDRILQLVEEKDFLEGVNDQFGQPTWTKDLAKFALSLVEQKKAYGIYHGTNSGTATWYTWAQEILKIKDIAKELRENSMRNFANSGHTAPRPQYGILLNTKINSMRTWQEALKEYLTNSND